MATAQNTDTKKKKKRGCFWRIVFWLALIVFIGSVGTLGYLFYTYWQGQNEYEEIASRVVEVPEDGHVANLADLVVDWDALRAINPDIVAWVYMPGTIINYPVAHKDGDSEYYLHHNFSLGEGSFGAEFGSIMLSGENAGDFSDEVNILYGHHMRNGSMFALFAEFRDSAIFNEHRTIYLLTPEGNYRLQTFAVEHVPMTHSSIATPNYPTDEEFTASRPTPIPPIPSPTRRSSSVSARATGPTTPGATSLSPMLPSSCPSAMLAPTPTKATRRWKTMRPARLPPTRKSEWRASGR